MLTLQEYCFSIGNVGYFIITSYFASNEKLGSIKFEDFSPRTADFTCLSDVQNKNLKGFTSRLDCWPPKVLSRRSQSSYNSRSDVFR